jgi:2-polyprenyl-3-methyl-5-hydroxy-6-metoxy-1,4-benzoquinol methylase
MQVEKAVCCLCGGNGELLYDALVDDLFHAPGSWSLRKCASDGIAWLSPRPATAEMERIYARYYTHAEKNTSPAGERMRLGIAAAAARATAPELSKAQRVFFCVLAKLPVLRDLGAGASRALKVVPGGRLLDVGCGDGRFLDLARRIGWKTQGIEPDAVASERARSRGLSVLTATLEQARLPSASFDAVTMHHIVEHLPDPMRTLREAARILKEDGRLAVFTPNLSSYHHRVFREDWRDLDPPRHFYLFSEKNLPCLLESAGFEIVELRSSHRWGAHIACVSASLRRSSRRPRSRYERFYRVCAGGTLQACDAFIRRFAPFSGDELVAIARVQRQA